MERELILKRLLEKYATSKHLSQPGVSNRRVMLRIDKNDLPEYVFETAEIRDRFNSAARMLENENLVKLEFLSDRAILKAIVLNLDQVYKAYQMANLQHPVHAAKEFCEDVAAALSDVKTPWILSWRDDVCKTAAETLRLPQICRHGITYVKELLSFLVYYDSLSGSTITVRALSAACFRSSKRFEQEFQDDFLRIATTYNPEIAEYLQHEELGSREKLAILGIFSHPELYQLSGSCFIITRTGALDITPLYPFGLAISSSIVDEIYSFDLRTIRKIIFIENLTNYNEYLRNEIKSDELVVYHGGFLSPKKKTLFYKMAESLTPDISVYFWADIDLGGFLMFDRLQRIFPRLAPMMMSAVDVEMYFKFGLKREAAYLERLESALRQQEFPVFADSIRMILKYGVTIEQEVFLL